MNSGRYQKLENLEEGAISPDKSEENSVELQEIPSDKKKVTISGRLALLKIAIDEISTQIENLEKLNLLITVNKTNVRQLAYFTMGLSTLLIGIAGVYLGLYLAFVKNDFRVFGFGIVIAAIGGALTLAYYPSIPTKSADQVFSSLLSNIKKLKLALTEIEKIADPESKQSIANIVSSIQNLWPHLIQKRAASENLLSAKNLFNSIDLSKGKVSFNPTSEFTEINLNKI